MEGQDSPSSVKDSKTYETNEENMQQWTAISLTHVEYIKGNIISKLDSSPFNCAQKINRHQMFWGYFYYVLKLDVDVVKSIPIN